MKNKLLLIRCVYFLLFGKLIGQNSENILPEKKPNEKMFNSLGTSVYLDIYNGPIREKKITATDPFGNTVTSYDYVRVSGFSYFTLIYHYRYNLHEFNNEMAFGLSALPAAGIFAGGSIPTNSSSYIPANYSGCFNLPLMAGFHIGATATNTSSAAMGLFFGAGYEYNAAPLFYARTASNKDIATKWMNPCVSLGLKYESNSNFGNMQEVNLKVGFGFVGTDFKDPSNFSSTQSGGFIFPKPVTIRIAYFTYLNY